MRKVEIQVIYIPIKFQKDVVDTIPKATKIIMNDEGHAVVIENPKKVLTEIISFLKGT